MNRKTMGIGMALAVLMLAVMAVPAMAAPNTVYFVPQSSGADLGGTAYVEVWLDLTDPYGTDPAYGLSAIQVNVTFNPSIGDITACNRVPGDPWALSWGKFQWGDSWWITADMDPWEDPTEPYGLDPGVYPIANLTIEGVNAGAMDLHFSRDQPRACDLKDAIGVVYPNQIWTDGTFTCTGAGETYTKTLTEGWNLISLPLTADDMTRAAVIDASLTGSYDYLYKYDATTHIYEELDEGTDEMANGVGYFINITATPADWEYGGQPYMSMNEGLSDGLNMIGWLNCTKDISTTSLDDPTKTYYISRWDAAMQEYETYNPAAPGDFNDFAQMDRGEGYFVSMKTSGTLTESC